MKAIRCPNKTSVHQADQEIYFFTAWEIYFIIVADVSNPLIPTLAISPNTSGIKR
jgi:hypothetical protein